MGFEQQVMDCPAEGGSAAVGVVYDVYDRPYSLETVLQDLLCKALQMSEVADQLQALG